MALNQIAFATLAAIVIATTLSGKNYSENGNQFVHHLSPNSNASGAPRESIRFDFGESCLSSDDLFECELIGGFPREATLSFGGNIKVESYSRTDNGFAFSILLPQGLGNLDIDIGNFDANHACLYSFGSNDGIFHISSLSDYSAMYDAGVIQGQNLQDHDLEAGPNAARIENDESVDQFNQTRDIVSGRVYGYLKYKDKQGNDYPLVGAKVKLTFTGSWGTAEGYTNTNGYYDKNLGLQTNDGSKPSTVMHNFGVPKGNKILLGAIDF